MKRCVWGMAFGRAFCRLVIGLVCVVLFSFACRADIIASGYIYPSDPETWTSSNYCTIGDNGSDGEMTVNGGSDISVSSTNISNSSLSTGKVTVSGEGSTWTSVSNLYVGRYGSGELNISEGAEVTSGGNSYIADYSDSVSQANVDGSGSLWSCENMTIGRAGDATLHVTNGGEVRVENYCGVSSWTTSTSSVSIDGTGSLLSALFLDLSWRGNSTMSVTNGAEFRGEIGALLGRISGSSSVLTVDGVGSRFIADNGIVDDDTWLCIGYSGTGTLNITNGGFVCSSGKFIIDEDEETGSRVNMATGGTLALKGRADGTIDEFMDLVGGTDELYFCSDNTENWQYITDGVLGEDYTLSYITDSSEEFYGYTVLTIAGAPTVSTAVPEPSTALLFAIAGVGIAALRSRNRRK